MTRNVFDNAMTAHVWAQQTQESGKSHNGNLYFEGRALYSYGSHFVAGYVLPSNGPGPVRAVISADSYSVSTGKHLSYAARALSYGAPRVPGLTDLSRVIEGATGAAEYWAGRADSDGKAKGKAAMRAGRAALAEFIAGPKAPARAELGRRYSWPSFPAFPELAAAWAFESLGMTEAEAARAASKTLAARARNAAAWAEVEKESAVVELLNSARQFASVPLADLGAELKAETRGQYFSYARHGSDWLHKATLHHRAAKAAKGKGWGRMAAAIKARESLIRETVKDWPGLELLAHARGYLRESIATIRTARALGRAATAYQLDSALERAAIVGLIVPDDGAKGTYARHMAAMQSAEGAAYFRRVLAVAGHCSAEGKAFWAAWAADTRAELGRLERASARASWRTTVAAVRAARAEGPDSMAEAVFNRAEQSLRAAALIVSSPFTRAGWTRESLTAESVVWRNRATAARAARAELAEATRKQWLADCRDAWRAMRARPERPAMVLPHHASAAARLDDGTGGALLRAEGAGKDSAGAIVAGTLKTSWGAEVPLPHAVRAFRFLKLCRDNGRAWRANGKTLPVGHFRIESIDAQGNFVAGCHRINWGEVERVAASLGLTDLAPADTTESRQFA